MIRKSLQSKLIISYLAVALLTVLVVSVVIRQTSGQQFYNLVAEQQAALLKEEAVYYYEQTGSWDGFQESFSPHPGDLPPDYLNKATPDSNSTVQEGKPPFPSGFNRQIRGKHGLVDSHYRAIIPFMDYAVGETVPAALLKNLIPVDVGGVTVAWIIPDANPQTNLSAEEKVFLSRTNQAILVAALAGVIGAVLMGIVLARNFLKPVRSLIGASRQMAAGDLEQQVPVHSQDELGQLSQTFNQMSADLASADRQRKQMTADITHDLSTPLQVIAGYMEMLEDEEITLTPQRVQTIMNEVELLRRLVGDLSLLTTADAKELQMQLEPIAPGALLGQICQTYVEIAQRAEKEIRCEAAENLPRITVDEGRTAQVLRNLVDNALRHTPAGGRVTLLAAVAQGMVEIRVSDTGSGIHPDDLPYVFDRFYRADPSRSSQTGKMGLGLAIARALVQAQGGTIYVESPGRGQGTTFVLRFEPARDAPRSAE